jgi:hypothetical protein
MTAGTPSLMAIFLLIPFWKRKILDRLLKTWKTAVIPKTSLKLMNIEAKGTNNIDEPKPLIVPMISASRANKKNK